MSLYGMRYGYHNKYIRLDEYIERYINQNIKFTMLPMLYDIKIEVKNFVINIILGYKYDDYSKWNVWNIDSLYNELNTEVIRQKEYLIKQIQELGLDIIETNFTIDKYRREDIEHKALCALKLTKESIRSIYVLAKLEGYHITDYKNNGFTSYKD